VVEPTQPPEFHEEPWFKWGFGGLQSLIIAPTIRKASRLRSDVSRLQLLSIAIAYLDFILDSLFLIEAWTSNPDSTLPLLATIFLAAPMLVGAAVGKHALGFASYLDGDALKENVWFYSLLFLLSWSNLDVLCLLPWKPEHREFDGFPTKRLLRLTHLTSLLEDVPQMAIQITYITTVEDGATSFVALASLTMSAITLLLKLVKKEVVLLFVEKAGELTSDATGIEVPPEVTLELAATETNTKELTL
jgi:hypothetical protein